MYATYKPLRNRLRKYALRPCLQQLWSIFQHVQNGRSSPYPDVPLRDIVQPWILNVLARELVLHAGSSPTGRTFANAPHFLDVVRAVKHVANEVQRGVVAAGGIVDEVPAMIYQQLPWSHKRTQRAVLRSWRLLSSPRMATIVQRVKGTDVKTVFQLGIDAAARLQDGPELDITKGFAETVLIPADTVKRFYESISTTVGALRAKAQKVQRYDRNWFYTWNPLEATPLLALDASRPYMLTCPIPEHVLGVLGQGLYYDFVNEPDFAEYGYAFEDSVGDLLRALFPESRYAIQQETPYRIGNASKHGVDWIVSDGTAHLFIECKTKRLTLNAKMAGDTAAVSGQLDVMAKMVVQHYKNIADAMAKHTLWQPDGLPIYPVVLTLEDWHLFGPAVGEELHRAIRTKLTAAKLSSSMLDEMPYAIVAVDDFVEGAAIASQLGLAPFFGDRMTETYRFHKLSDYALERWAALCASVEVPPVCGTFDALLNFEVPMSPVGTRTT